MTKTPLAPLGDRWPLPAHPLVDAARAALVTWLDLLAQWNARIDLTAARSADELVDLMVADALVLAERLVEGARVVDVGTGAGAPGLALALLRPDLAVTLVEPLGKRVTFLRTVIGTIGRADVRVLRARGEDVEERFDVALSRATVAPAAWLAMGAHLAPEVWVLLAKEEPPALEGARLVEDVKYEWPKTAASRRAVRYAIAGA